MTTAPDDDAGDAEARFQALTEPLLDQPETTSGPPSHPRSTTPGSRSSRRHMPSLPPDPPCPVRRWALVGDGQVR
jgi:hypothetical protein